MDYELAKKLKEAGFPIKTEDIGEITWKPTLSELIEACGNEFTHIKKTYRGWEAYYNGEEVRSDNHYFFGKGENPEEAVANLYLALHPPKS